MCRKISVLGIIIFISLLLIYPAVTAQVKESVDEDFLKVFEYRNIGPSKQGGRITDIAVPLDQPYTFYLASATGGLWKTTNNGVTFEPIFDNQGTYSLGDIAVAPSDSHIVWVGTGEASNARSTYWGDGVYKSPDGGKTWQHMGLKDSHHIGRIVIHPQNPDIVYVAAMGHLFSSNDERGLYKTEDGGKTWNRVLFINDKVGVIDVVMNPQDPEALLAAAYDKQRWPWHFEAAGPESAVYKSADGGKTWERLGGGLPGGKIGRIGLDIYAKDPNVVYAAVENANPRPETKAKSKTASKKRQRRPQLVGGEIYRSDDGGITWKKMNADKKNIGGMPGYYYGQIRIDPNDDKTIYVLSVNLFRSTDGGKTWGQGRNSNAAPRTHSDHHALWIDPKNSSHLLLGNDGGLYITYDKGMTWDFYENLPLAQYYAVGVDMEHPYNVYGGLQDNGSWKGASNGLTGQVTRNDWSTVGTGDGMYNQVDPHDSRWLYNDYQFGMIQRVDQKLRKATQIKPRRERGEPPLRFNWNSPIVISPHNSQIIYFGGNVLFKSVDRGDNWQEISPDLTLNDPVKIAGEGNIQYCTITTISESPLAPGMLWVGTDDGKVHVTRDGGAAWKEVTAALVAAGAPEEFWVSRVFASNHEEGTAYVAKTGYRRDDFRAVLYKTTDFGKSWVSLANGLPEESVNVVFEDRKNPNLLFAGTDFSVYVSLTGGKSWTKMQNNMPRVAVHDLLIHPRENDLVVGTHGRGIFITDISPLQQATDEVFASDAHLFEPEPTKLFTISSSMFDGFNGHRHFTAANAKQGLAVYYYLKAAVEESVKVVITDPYGAKLKTIKAGNQQGLHTVSWEVRPTRRKPDVAGDYLVTLEIGEKKLSQKARILK